MRLTLWRHGEAESAVNDEARELTVRGQKDIVFMADDYATWVKALAIEEELSLLLYSPYRRTAETAQLLADLLCPARQHVDPLLAPGATVSLFSDQVFAEHGLTIMVSHQPFLSQAIAFLTNDMTLAPLAPGGYSALEVTCLTRGGAALLRHRPDPRDAVSSGTT